MHFLVIWVGGHDSIEKLLTHYLQLFAYVIYLHVASLLGYRCQGSKGLFCSACHSKKQIES